MEGGVQAPFQTAVRNIERLVSPEAFAASHDLCMQLHRPWLSEPDTSVQHDLRYGPHERHRLDFYPRPEDTSRQATVLFVHGGGFTAGDTRREDSFIYRNVAAWARSIGFATANIAYRLAPESPWPAGAEDIRRAISWLLDQERQGSKSIGDIYLLGHSAGASHVASWVAGHANAGTYPPQVKGAALVSGVYGVDAMNNPGLEAYFGPLAQRTSKSSIQGVANSPLAILLAAADLDPPEYIRQWELAVAARTGAGRATTHRLLTDQNHFTEIQHLGPEPDELGIALASFVAARMLPELVSPRDT